MAKPCARMASTARGATLGMSITLTKMLALLALATPTVAYYDGPRGYCSPFTARYLTLIDDVLVFHGGQPHGRPDGTCRPYATSEKVARPRFRIVVG